MKRSLWWYVITIGLLGLLSAFRFWNLESFPAFIHNDESAAAYYIVPEFLGGGRRNPFWGFSGYGGHFNFGPWLSSIPALLTGVNSFLNCRIAAAVSGIASVIFFAAALRTTYGDRVAALFMLGIAPFHLHVHFSRTGFTYIHAVLFSGVLSYVFALFTRNPSRKNALVLGCCTALAIMTYSASHVLPGAVGVGLLAVLTSEQFRERYPNKRLLSWTILVILVLTGFLAICSSQFVYLWMHGWPTGSRWRTQTILGHFPGQALPSSLLLHDQLKTTVYPHILKTFSFFFGQDGAVQYGSPRGLCELWSGMLACLGALVIIARAALRDPFALFLVVVAISTAVGSCLFVEASFSPHFIVFSLLTPGAVAIGFDWTLRLLRIRSVPLVASLACLLFIPWAWWNVDYLKQIDAAKFNTNTWLLRLPVPRHEVLQLVNASSQYADVRESMYPLIYPRATFKVISTNEGLDQALNLAGTGACPCVLLVGTQDEQYTHDFLTGAGKTFRVLSDSRIPAKVFYIEKPSSQR